MARVRCLECGAELESMHVHDFVMCDCPNKTFADGGKEYLRCGGVDFKKVEVISEIDEEVLTTLASFANGVKLGRFEKEMSGLGFSKAETSMALLRLAKAGKLKIDHKKKLIGRLP